MALAKKHHLNSGFLWAVGLGVWTLALARYLAEALFVRLFFSSPWAVGGIALGGAALGLALCFFAPPAIRPRLERAWPPLFLSLLYLLAPRAAPPMGLVLLAGGLALAAAGLLSEQRLHTLTLPALLAVTLGLYLETLGRSVGQADTFEFQVVAPTLGVAHPTGYPLFILLGKLFSLFPFGSIAWRVNLTSAGAATAALAVLYELLLRLERQPLTALLAVMALAFSRVLWSQAVVAEVYALNLFFVAAALSLLWRLLEGKGGPSTVRALALLLGLSLTNHLTMVLLLPAVALTLLLARPRLDGRQWAGAAALFLLGLAVYAYIPLRWPALHDGRWMGAGEFLAYITGRQFSGALQWELLRSPTRYLLVGRLLLQPFGWAGAALAAFGLLWLAARRRRLALLTAPTFLLYALYGVAYLVPDISVFMLPAHLLMALWMASGLAALVNAARRLPAWLPSLLLALFALLPLSRIWLNLEAVDQSGRNQAEMWGRAVLDLPLAPGAAVLADGEKFAPLYYLQQIEGLRPDLDLVVHFSESEYRADLLARLNAGQTVYLARYLPGLEGYALRSASSACLPGSRALIYITFDHSLRPEAFDPCFERLLADVLEHLGAQGAIWLPLDDLDDVKTKGTLDDRTDLARLQVEGGLFHLRGEQHAAREKAQVASRSGSRLVLGKGAGQIGKVGPSLELGQDLLCLCRCAHQDVAGMDVFGGGGDSRGDALDHRRADELRPQLAPDILTGQAFLFQPRLERLLAARLGNDLGQLRFHILIGDHDAHLAGRLLDQHLFDHPVEDLFAVVPQPFLPLCAGQIDAGGDQDGGLPLGHLALIVDQVDRLAVDPRGQRAVGRWRCGGGHGGWLNLALRRRLR